MMSNLIYILFWIYLIKIENKNTKFNTILLMLKFEKREIHR